MDPCTPASDLDAELAQWAIAARECATTDYQRTVHLSRLIGRVQKSKKLTRPTTATIGRSHPAYEEIYQEACGDLWEWACRHIQNYDPTRSSVLGWLNFYLNRRFFPEAAKRLLQYDRPLAIQNEDQKERLWEQVPDPSDPEATSGLERYFLQTSHYLRESQNPVLDKCVKGIPEATLRQIMHYKLQGKTLEEIAIIFGSNYSTIHSFYRRKRDTIFQEIREFADAELGLVPLVSDTGVL